MAGIADLNYDWITARRKNNRIRNNIINARPENDKKQTTLKEFEGDKMKIREFSDVLNEAAVALRNMRDRNIGNALSWLNKSDANGRMAMRGTFGNMRIQEQNPGKGRVPEEFRHQQNYVGQTKAVSPLKQHMPTGGVTPIGNNKGPTKKANDNIVKKRNREVQGKYDIGAQNKGVQRMLGAQFGNPTGRFMNRVGQIFSFLDDSKQIGRGIEVAELFGKTNNKTEDACNDNKKEKLVTSEKGNKDKWIQKAVPEKNKGKFTDWCKDKGFSGVSQECIDAARKEGGHAARMANFAVNVSKGKYK